MFDIIHSPLGASSNWQKAKRKYISIWNLSRAAIFLYYYKQFVLIAYLEVIWPQTGFFFSIKSKWNMRMPINCHNYIIIIRKLSCQDWKASFEMIASQHVLWVCECAEISVETVRPCGSDRLSRHKTLN